MLNLHNRYRRLHVETRHFRRCNVEERWSIHTSPNIAFISCPMRRYSTDSKSNYRWIVAR